GLSRVAGVPDDGGDRQRLAAREAGAGGAAVRRLDRQRALAQAGGARWLAAFDHRLALVQRIAGDTARRDRLAGAGETVLARFAPTFGYRKSSGSGSSTGTPLASQ